MKKILAATLITTIILTTTLTLILTHTPQTAAQAPGYVSVVDDLGRRVVLEKIPERIVSLSPSATEILFALGLGPKVVGVTRFCDYPPEALGKEKVGGFSNPSVEKVVSLNPDLVVADAGIQAGTVERLGKLGLKVVALKPKNVEEILDRIRMLGRLTGMVEEAEKLTSEMKARMEAVRERVKHIPESDRPKVYYEVWHDPLMSVGPGSFIHVMLEEAGGVNIFRDAKTDYPLVSPEAVIERNPDVIITTKHNPASLDEIRSRPGWDVIKAIKLGRLYKLDDNIIVRYGPRVVEGLEALARVMHPTLFT